MGKGKMKIECPQCKSNAYKKNGYTRHGKQNHRCLECGRQFSVDSDAIDFKSDDRNISVSIDEHAEECVS